MVALAGVNGQRENGREMGCGGTVWNLGEREKEREVCLSVLLWGCSASAFLCLAQPLLFLPLGCRDGGEGGYQTGIALGFLSFQEGFLYLRTEESCV